MTTKDIEKIFKIHTVAPTKTLKTDSEILEHIKICFTLSKVANDTYEQIGGQNEES